MITSRNCASRERSINYFRLYQSTEVNKKNVNYTKEVRINCNYVTHRIILGNSTNKTNEWRSLKIPT